jgi:pyrroline-5-carboxylate reductase
MTTTNETLAVFGFGNMGEAVIDGAIRAGVLAPASVLVVEPDREKLAKAASLGCRVSVRGEDAIDAPRVLLAVKPQSFDELAPRLRGRPARTLFVTVMAGIGGARILRAVGDSATHAVVRAMPNTPCRFGVGMTGIAPSSGSTESDLLFAHRLFDAVGRTVRIDESQLDAVTATSASGPAYLFLLAEAWEAAAIDLGFAPPVARELVRQTIAGAARMLEDRNVDARDLRAAVTSKGGTTAAAVASIGEERMRTIMTDALRAAERRGRELGG